MPRSIDSDKEETRWNIIDASRFTNQPIIELLSSKVNVILIHILASDLVNISDEKILSYLTMKQLSKQKIIYLVRDIDAITDMKMLESKEKILRNKNKNLQFVYVKSMILKEVAQNNAEE